LVDLGRVVHLVGEVEPLEEEPVLMHPDRDRSCLAARGEPANSDPVRSLEGLGKYAIAALRVEEMEGDAATATPCVIIPVALRSLSPSSRGTRRVSPRGSPGPTPCELVAVKSWTGITARPSVMSRFFSARGMLF
jgi:hypothetical protein